MFIFHCKFVDVTYFVKVNTNGRSWRITNRITPTYLKLVFIEKCAFHVVSGDACYLFNAYEAQIATFNVHVCEYLIFSLDFTPTLEGMVFPKIRGLGPMTPTLGGLQSLKLPQWARLRSFVDLSRACDVHSYRGNMTTVYSIRSLAFNHNLSGTPRLLVEIRNNGRMGSRDLILGESYQYGPANHSGGAW